MADVRVEKTSSEQQQQGRERGVERHRPGQLERGEWYQSDIFTNPFALMRRLSEEMDRAFSTSFGLWRGAGREMTFAPAIEIREENNNVVVCADLPGINKDDVHIEATHDGLILQGERKHEAEESRGGIHRSERSYGRFYRVVPLPEGAEVDKAKAQFKDGVLEVKVPLSEARKPRQIPIGDRKSVV